MRSIYLVMSQTGSILSKTIKKVTGDEYNHISISLDDKLNCMYSFGRKYLNIPFIGVFVVENIERTLEKFDDTKCKVIEVQLTDEQYQSLRINIGKMLIYHDKYKYNLLGLFLALFKIEFHPKTKFYCSEFVRYILEQSNIDVSMISTIPHPIEFDKIGCRDVYEGPMKSYSLKR